MAGRYFRRGKSKVTFATTVAVPAAPTVAENTAGTALHPQIAEMSGYEFNNSPIATPDLSTTFTTTIPGEDTAGDPTLVFYDLDDASTPIRTALAKGSAGFVLLLPYGTVTTRRCETWAVVSTGINDVWTTSNEAAKFNQKMAVSAAPVQNAVFTA